MAHSTASPLQRQVTRVRRRLFLQTLVRSLIWSWFGALTLTAVWFLLQPLLIDDKNPLSWIHWAVLGGAVFAATGLAVAVAVMRRASPVQAALALDERFQLKERITTSLMLRADEIASSAGAALLADANQCVEPLRVGDRFPVRIPWTAALAPAVGVVLVLLAVFYHPDFGQARDSTPPAVANNEAMKAEIDKVRHQLQAKREANKDQERPKSAELKKIEAEIDKMLSNPHETKDQVREDIKQGDALLDDLKKQDKDQAERARALKEQMQQLERAQEKDDLAKNKDGPAKDMKKALDQGDLAKAKEQADELAKKLQNEEEADELRKKLNDDNGKLTPQEKKELQDELKKKEEAGLTKEDRQNLQEQLKDMEDDAKELTKKDEDEEKKLDEEAEELEKQAKNGEIDQEQLQREKQKLEKSKGQLQRQKQDLKELAQKLKDAQQAMKEGKDAEAAQKLKEAGDKMAQMDGDGERADIAQAMRQVQQMKRALSQALARQEGQEGGDKGNGQGPSGPNKGGQGSGARGESADAKTGEEEHQVHSDPDDKARLQIIDHVPGEGFKGPRKPAEMTDEIRRAAQEGAAASERERLTDKATAEMARGFFEKMRPPDKDDRKAAPKP
jgi:hypothetical protein